MSEHDETTIYSDEAQVAAVAAVVASEHPVPLRVFAADLKGSDDEVYTRLLKKFHGERPRTPSEWRALIASEGAKPVPRDMPRPAALHRRRG